MASAEKDIQKLIPGLLSNTMAVWKYFHRLPTRKGTGSSVFAQCKLCEDAVDYETNNYETLVAHIKTEHPNGPENDEMCKNLHYDDNDRQLIERYVKSPAFSRGKKSKVWLYFDFETVDGTVNKKYVVCQLCTNSVKYCGNTTNMDTHLHRYHVKEWGMIHPNKVKELINVPVKVKSEPDGSDSNEDDSKSVVNTEQEGETNVASNICGQQMLSNSQLVSFGPHAKSKAWNYFGFKMSNGKVDRSRAICSLCSLSLKYESSTYRLTYHLLKMHKTEYEQGINANSFVCAHSFAQSTGAIANFIIHDLQPYSILEEGSAFRNMLVMVNSNFTLPAKITFTQDVIPEKYEALVSKVKEEISKASCVALRIEKWGSSTFDSYLTLSGNFIVDWQERKFVLDTHACLDSKMSEILDGMLQETTTKWQFASPVCAVVNCVDIQPMQDATSCQLIECFGEILNNAVGLALKLPVVDPLLNQIRKLVSLLRNESVWTGMLKEKQNELGMVDIKVVADDPAYWTTTYDMCDKISQLLPVLKCFFAEPLTAGLKDEYELTDNQMEILHELLQVLTPIKLVSVSLCSESTPSASMIMPLIYQIKNVSLDIDVDDTPIIQSVKNTMAVALENCYRSDTAQEILHLSSQLDPRFKHMFFASHIQKERIKRKIVEEMLDTAKEVDMRVGVNDDDTTESPASKRIKLDGKANQSQNALNFLFKDVCRTSSVKKKHPKQAVETEWKCYMAEEPIDISENPLNWWKSKGNGYPILSKVAVKYLSIPGTSVPPQRLFTRKGLEFTQKRSRIKPKHMNKLLFLNGNQEFI